MSEVIAMARGQNGVLELTERYVRIKRKTGFFSAMVMGQSGDKELLILQISAIQLKKPDRWMNGFIQFSVIGSREERSAAWDVARDENSVIFVDKQLKEIEAFKCAVERQMDKSNQPKLTSPSYIEELEKLSELRERGVLSEEEFQAKKKHVLGL